MKALKRICIPLLFLLMVMGLVACGQPKEPVDVAAFEDACANSGIAFTMYDLSASSGIKEATAVSVALADEYQVEFYVFDTANSAQYYFNNLKNQIVGGRHMFSSKTEVNLSNYKKYTQSADGLYGAVTLIDNTVLFTIDVPEGAKASIKDLFDTLGY